MSRLGRQFVTTNFKLYTKKEHNIYIYIGRAGREKKSSGVCSVVL